MLLTDEPRHPILINLHHSSIKLDASMDISDVNRFIKFKFKLVGHRCGVILVDHNIFIPIIMHVVEI